MSETKQAINQAHALFEIMPVAPKCNWFSRNGSGAPDDGEDSVGNGLFCLPSHDLCFIASVCERHKKKLDDWQ